MPVENPAGDSQWVVECMSGVQKNGKSEKSKFESHQCIGCDLSLVTALLKLHHLLGVSGLWGGSSAN